MKNYQESLATISTDRCDYDGFQENIKVKSQRSKNAYLKELAPKLKQLEPQQILDEQGKEVLNLLNAGGQLNLTIMNIFFIRNYLN